MALSKELPITIRTTYPLLDRALTPTDLRRLHIGDLPKLARELRTYLIDSVSQTGGHLAAGLGVVELSIALHYVLATPHDRLIWDVGHQAYPHKILTGRKARMSTLRQWGGLAGFLHRNESEYDCFGAGHAGTSISAALGMAVAAQQSHNKREVVAVIGDASLASGMAFEAMNHAGDLGADLLVILNDNNMSISPSVGAINNRLAQVLSSRFYAHFREGGKTLLSGNPLMQDLAKRWEEHTKGMLMPGTLFEELGFKYIGPVDGHDLFALVPTLRNMLALKGCRFLHIVTQKGKGYKPAEGNPCEYHGVRPFDPQTGKSAKTTSKCSYSQVFGQWLCDAAARDSRLCAITPAMCEGSGMVEFARIFPKRFFDTGIAEQHTLTFAAGLACEGYKPVVAIYSTFLQRAYDQLIHDIALQNLDVTLAIDRAGLVGEDGPTHAGSFDLSYLSCIPNMVIMTPTDGVECHQMLYTAFQHQGPAAVRYPRGNVPKQTGKTTTDAIKIGRGTICKQGKKLAFLVFGGLLETVLEVAEFMDATVANMRFCKPLDLELIDLLAEHHNVLISLEEGAIYGGAGASIAAYLGSKASRPKLLLLGIPDQFIPHGSYQEQMRACGLDAEGIRESASKAMA